MSDVQETTGKVLAEIKITVTDQTVHYDTGTLSLPDMLFWMRTVEAMIMNQVTGHTPSTASEG